MLWCATDRAHGLSAEGMKGEIKRAWGLQKVFGQGTPTRSRAHHEVCRGKGSLLKKLGEGRSLPIGDILDTDVRC